MKLSKRVADLVERVGAAVGAAFAVAYDPLVFGPMLENLPDETKAKVAGGIGLVVLVLGLLGVRVGDKEDAGLVKHKLSK